MVGSLHGWALQHPSVVSTLKVLQDVLSPNVFRAATLLVAVALWRAGSRKLAVWAVVSTAGGALLGVVLKQVVQRARPSFPDPVAMAGSYSFPSGHAMSSFLGVGVGVLLVIAVPGLGRTGRVVAWSVGVLLVLLTGFDRIALGVHYTSDVLAGRFAPARPQGRRGAPGRLTGRSTTTVAERPERRHLVQRAGAHQLLVQVLQLRALVQQVARRRQHPPHRRRRRQSLPMYAGVLEDVVLQPVPQQLALVELRGLRRRVRVHKGVHVRLRRHGRLTPHRVPAADQMAAVQVVAGVQLLPRLHLCRHRASSRQSSIRSTSRSRAPSMFAVAAANRRTGSSNTVKCVYASSSSPASRIARGSGTASPRNALSNPSGPSATAHDRT